jgi:uncharacterized RDD family membrane protein YckC
MVPYGGFWWRVLAYIIDGIVMNIASSIIGGIFGFGMMMPFAGFGANPEAINWGAVSGIMLVSNIINWVYFAGMESSKFQGTLGKLTIGLVVTDVHGERISFLRATGRYFAKILSGLVLLIGFIMVAFTERKQGLHDILASTLVYKTRDPQSIYDDRDVFA